MSIKYIFLGGIFSDKQKDFVISNSIGVIQNAADALQKNIIDGLDQLINNDLFVVNLPFIGSYPRLFKNAYFPSVFETIGKQTTVKGVGFINIFAFKIVSRLFATTYTLFKTCRKGNVILFIYSAHLPFILSAFLIKLINLNVKICLILPDLPEYMGSNNFLYTIFKRIDTSIFYFLIKKIDFFVVLTKFMAERMQIDMKKVVVIEGVISSLSSIVDILPHHNRTPRSFLYTGTLALRYGITDLVDAFEKIEDLSSELWICGDGDAKAYVLTAAQHNIRIKYFGQISRDEVIKLQSEASILVNPRTPEGEFTKYSFPSKIMEYMASGRPVIMYHLDGIPEEYNDHFISPNKIGIDALSQCMNLVLEMSDDQLNLIGLKARDFVLNEKNPLKQAEKILNLVLEKN